MKRLLALLAFMLSNQALADPLQPQAVVLICEIGKECTLETARIVFMVPLESPLPAQCLESGMKKIAEVSELVAPNEAPRVQCK